MIRQFGQIFRPVRFRRFPILPIGAVAITAAFAAFPVAVAGQVVPGDEPVIVQPGRPGEQSKILPANTRAKLPPVSASDVEFMRGMIMHHAQAVEMTAFIETRTENREVRRLGARISQSQADEIRFMTRWLESRGQTVDAPKAETTGGHRHHGSSEHVMMPGMLSADQMEELRKAKGAEFDRLFLKGMIQHHEGALVMVKELFAAAGSGQDAELFNFATDVDSGQRAEIKAMQTLLAEKP
jgi:uncharacterized protein (DUF305 family)